MQYNEILTTGYLYSDEKAANGFSLVTGYLYSGEIDPEKTEVGRQLLRSITDEDLMTYRMLPGKEKLPVELAKHAAQKGVPLKGITETGELVWSEQTDVASRRRYVAQVLLPEMYALTAGVKMYAESDMYAGLID